MDDTAGIELNAFIRPGTPPSAAATIVTQVIEMHDFGLLPLGSQVWANMDAPNALWVLSDTSMFLRFVDVPVAGWARMTRNSVVWGRVANDTAKSPSHGFSTADMPMPVQDYDVIAVAFRNADSHLMRAQFGAKHHPFRDYRIDYGSMRVIDFKTSGMGKIRDIAPPIDYYRNHAGTRGLDLMSCTTGPHMHKVMRENPDAFSTVIKPIEFERITVAHQKIWQVTEDVMAPIAQNIAELGEIGPFIAGTEDEDLETQI